MSYPWRILALGVVALSAAGLWAANPSWWSTRAVLNSNPADDYAAANLGQLKYIATKAAAELNATLPSGAGSSINGLISTWQAAPGVGVVRDDYAALNQGQLKNIAGLFYQRLTQNGYKGTPHNSWNRYPWSTSTTDDDDYALVNLGQLKYVFSFLSTGYMLDGYMADNDLDGIADGWESEHGLSSLNSADAAIVVGGLTNLQRYQQFVAAGSEPAAGNAVGLVVYSP